MINTSDAPAEPASLYHPPRREREYTPEQLLELARDNHIWLNAFSLIQPTDDFLREIGRSVVTKLHASPIRDDLIGLSKVVYIRINAS
jgi:hypothetical protein